MPIFRVKSVKIYIGQKKFTRIYSLRSWQIWGMQLDKGFPNQLWFECTTYIVVYLSILLAYLYIWEYFLYICILEYTIYICIFDYTTYIIVCLGILLKYLYIWVYYSHICILLFQWTFNICQLSVLWLWSGKLSWVHHRG